MVLSEIVPLIVFFILPCYRRSLSRTPLLHKIGRQNKALKRNVNGNQIYLFNLKELQEALNAIFLP